MGGAAPLRSNISRLLVDRAREIAEMDKVFRVAKPENVVVCLLTEPLQPLQSCESGPDSNCAFFAFCPVTEVSSSLLTMTLIVIFDSSLTRLRLLFGLVDPPTDPKG